jgi:hypothetical protein
MPEPNQNAQDVRGVVTCLDGSRTLPFAAELKFVPQSNEAEAPPQKLYVGEHDGLSVYGYLMHGMTERMPVHFWREPEIVVDPKSRTQIQANSLSLIDFVAPFSYLQAMAPEEGRWLQKRLTAYIKAAFVMAGFTSTPIKWTEVTHSRELRLALAAMADQTTAPTIVSQSPGNVEPTVRQMRNKPTGSPFNSGMNLRNTRQLSEEEPVDAEEAGLKAAELLSSMQASRSQQAGRGDRGVGRKRRFNSMGHGLSDIEAPPTARQRRTQRRTMDAVQREVGEDDDADSILGSYSIEHPFKTPLHSGATDDNIGADACSHEDEQRGRGGQRNEEHASISREDTTVPIPRRDNGLGLESTDIREDLLTNCLEKNKVRKQRLSAAQALEVKLQKETQDGDHLRKTIDGLQRRLAAINETVSQTRQDLEAEREGARDIEHEIRALRGQMTGDEGFELAMRMNRAEDE